MPPFCRSLSLLSGVFRFLTGKKAIIPLTRASMRLQGGLVKNISVLGTSGFIMSVTNSAVQIICNATLQQYGGDLYVGIMTVINSVREILNIPVNGLSNSGQPVMSFNYGARKYDRVKAAIRFVTISCIVFTLVIWALIFFFPHAFIHVFNSDPSLLKDGVPSMHIYFFGIFMMRCSSPASPRLWLLAIPDTLSSSHCCEKPSSSFR